MLWNRSHLKHDLRPYVCTYNECTEPHVLYDSWEDWTRHEQWAHQQRVWRCSEHPQHEYVDLASYEEHVKTYHAASMHHLLSSELLQSQESVSQICDRPCPFCQREYETPIDLQKHVAGHLESIALLSLPNLDGIDETFEVGRANSNSANRNYAESRADDFDFEEALLFSEGDDLSGDMSNVTETTKELFSLRLEIENFRFDSMKEFSAKAGQGLPMSRLPIALDEEDEPLSKTRLESLSAMDLSPRILELLVRLNRLCSDLFKMLTDGTSLDFNSDLRSVQKMLHVMRERSSLQRLPQTPVLSIFAFRHYCEAILADMDKTISEYGSQSRKTRERAAQTNAGTARSKLSSISSNLSVLNDL